MSGPSGAPHPGPLPGGERETGGEREQDISSSRQSHAALSHPSRGGEGEKAALSHPLPRRGRRQGEGAQGEGAAASRVGSQRAYFPETGEVTMPRYDRTTLQAGAVVGGPAVIEDEWSTIVVYPGQRAAADAHGHLVLDRESAS